MRPGRYLANLFVTRLSGSCTPVKAKRATYRMLDIPYDLLLVYMGSSRRNFHGKVWFFVIH